MTKKKKRIRDEAYIKKKSVGEKYNKRYKSRQITTSTVNNK